MRSRNSFEKKSLKIWKERNLVEKNECIFITQLLCMRCCAFHDLSSVPLNISAHHVHTMTIHDKNFRFQEHSQQSLIIKSPGTRPVLCALTLTGISYLVKYLFLCQTKFIKRTIFADKAISIIYFLKSIIKNYFFVKISKNERTALLAGVKKRAS